MMGSGVDVLLLKEMLPPLVLRTAFVSWILWRADERLTMAEAACQSCQTQPEIQVQWRQKTIAIPIVEAYHYRIAQVRIDSHVRRSALLLAVYQQRHLCC